MSTFVGATEAARRLGVQKATLYAYVSRGLVERRVAVDGRTSLYSVDDLDSLARRGRRKLADERPSIDVQVVTSITTLDEHGPRYRGRDVAELARSVSFEQVAELLWTGALPDRVEWSDPSTAEVNAARRAAAAIPRGDGTARIIAAVQALGARHPGDDAPAAARRLFSVLPAVLAGGSAPRGGDPRLAPRLAAAWDPGARPALASALKRALIVLADHELATSTLAVRLAASVRATPYDSFVAGLAVVRGPLHGTANAAAYRLLEACERDGVAPAVAARLAAGERLPGFGHKIYAGDDPRLGPLREAMALLDDPHGRAAIVEELIAEAGMRITRRPNVDLGVAGLLFVAGLPGDVPLFAVARLAGFAAHHAEELGERPVRYRGLARTSSRSG